VGRFEPLPLRQGARDGALIGQCQCARQDPERDDNQREAAGPLRAVDSALLGQCLDGFL
jgi:hypothetical protein